MGRQERLRSPAPGNGLFSSLGRLRGSENSLRGQLAQDLIPFSRRYFRIAGRIVIAGRTGKRGDQGYLSGSKRARALAEVKIGRSPHSFYIATVWGYIEINFEKLVVIKQAFQLKRPERFDRF